MSTEAKRTIPELRARLIDLAGLVAQGGMDEIAEEICQIAEETRRRSSGRRAPSKSRRLSPELARAIRSYAMRHPHLSQQEIGNFFGLNAGRVSEAISGKRDGEAL